MRKIVLVAAIAAIVLLGGCAAPSERPGQATPSPTPTSSVTTESVAPASPTPSAPAETATPPLVNNWPELLSGYPEVAADLLKAGLAIEDVAAQAAIRTSAGKVPIATVKVAFGNTTGGDLISTGDCKASSGECPTDALIEGLLPLIEVESKEPLRDPSKGLLVVFNDDGHPRVLHGLNLNKR